MSEIVILSRNPGKLITAITGKAAVRGAAVDHGEGDRGKGSLAPLEVTLAERQWLTLRIPLIASEPQAAQCLTVMLEASSSAFQDYRRGPTALRMKPDADKKPFWVCPDSRIILEADSPVYKEAEALL